MATISAKISMAITALVSKAFDTGVQGAVDQRVSASLEFLSGTGLGQVDTIYTSRQVIAASANLDLDVSGALENQFGDVAVFAKIKAVLIRHISGVNNAVVGNAAANPFVGWFGAAVHTLVIPPTGAAMLMRNDAAGWAVVAGTGDLLRIANGGAGTPITVEISLLGTSA